MKNNEKYLRALYLLAEAYDEQEDNMKSDADAEDFIEMLADDIYKLFVKHGFMEVD